MAPSKRSGSTPGHGWSWRTPLRSSSPHWYILFPLLALQLLPVTSSSPSSTPASATTLLFGRQPSDRPVGFYRAPAPYQEPGRRALNSVIITSKPIGINEHTRDLMGTTATPSTGATVSPPTTSRSSLHQDGRDRDGHLGSWRRFSSSSPTTPEGATTERPSLTLSLPQYSIDCAEGLSCSETIAVDAATPRPTFKPYPQDVLDKFLRDLTAATRRHENDRRAEASSADRASNRLANLYLNEQEDEERHSAEHHSSPPAAAAASSEEDNEDGDDDTAGSEGKGRWHLLDAQEHRHPYDDRDGWVTLEPVPWSTSKVSKWQANRPKPNRWDTRPSSDWDKPTRPQWVRPSYASSSESGDYDQRPQRPSSLWPHTPTRPSSHWYSDNKPQSPSSSWNSKPEYEYEKPSTSSLHWASVGAPGQEIITDNRPNRWPEHHHSSSSSSSHHNEGGYRPWDDRRPYGGGTGSGGSSGASKPHYDYSHQAAYPNKRPGGGGEYEYYGGHNPHRHPSTHPEESDGQWVLVSSTKGYALPHRHKIYQRALAISAKPITSRRTVRLTVLPALNGTANTTISHGGLLEVESTFQSVEEEQKQQQANQLHQQQHQHYRPLIQHDLQYDNNIPSVQVVKPKTTQVRLLAQSAPRDNSRAVLAAVGAGMVPATLALMAPLVLGRKKRSATVDDLRFANRLQKQLMGAFERSPMHGKMMTKE